MLTKLRVRTADSKITLRCEEIAWDGRGYRRGYSGESLLALSAVGADTAVKAVRAMLCEPSVRAVFEWLPHPEDEKRHRTRLEKWMNGGRKAVGYEAKTSVIGRHAVHLVATARVDGLLADTSAEALWAELNGEGYTTPILKWWMPWLRGRLIESRLLTEAGGYSTNAGILSATTEQLDELVSEGVRTGRLELKGE